MPGLFAAGDYTGQPFQLIKAAGEGGTAALQVVKYLDSLKSPGLEALAMTQTGRLRLER